MAEKIIEIDGEGGMTKEEKDHAMLMMRIVTSHIESVLMWASQVREEAVGAIIAVTDKDGNILGCSGNQPPTLMLKALEELKGVVEKNAGKLEAAMTMESGGKLN